MPLLYSFGQPSMNVWLVCLVKELIAIFILMLDMLAQNLYLAAQTMKIKVCALGAFDDEQLNKNLGLDGNEQFVVYGAGVGK